jgi:hypothetical protein
MKRGTKGLGLGLGRRIWVFGTSASGRAFDPAASGDRLRIITNGWDVHAYVDGRWGVGPCGEPYAAEGQESDGKKAQKRALLVLRALTRKL